MKNTKSGVIIGLEVHVEINTDTKLFCGCPTKGSEEPNTRVCEVCLGQPGSKPVLNKKALEFALKLCLALNCKISKELIFSRKSYFYPDMAKNYQITQYEIPLGSKGGLKLRSGKEIGITRVHMEEDPAALIHPKGMQESAYVLVDYNRSGNPLLEIVTEPELESAGEAREFMKQLITILSYLGIFDINTGIIKADANVSIKESGFVKQEVKNITGFKEIERALQYEILRQKAEFGAGKKISQETRAWDSEKGITFLLRKKETEEDYGYILDSDLVKTEITKELLDRVKKEMPELAHDKVKRFLDEHKDIATKRKSFTVDAIIITKNKELAEFFDDAAKEVGGDLSAKWVRGELMRVLNYTKKKFNRDKMGKPIIRLLKLIKNKKITDNVASKILEKLIIKPFDVDEYIEKEELEAISNVVEILEYCKEAIKENPKAVEDYKKGEKKALNFIVGQVMKKTKGKATPKEVNEIILKIIK